MKLVLDKDLVSAGICGFLRLAWEHRGSSFSLVVGDSEVVVVPSAVNICDGGTCYFVTAFSPLLEGVEAVIFWVWYEGKLGLAKVYADGRVECDEHLVSVVRDLIRVLAAYC